MKSYSDGRIGTVVENRPAVGSSSDDKVQQRNSRARTLKRNKKKFSSYKFDGPGKPFDLIGTAPEPNGIISWEREKVAKGEEKKNRKSVVRD